MADTTEGIPTNAGAWEYLYDLVVARRVAIAQIPVQFPHARRLTFLAVGVVKLCHDPKNNPVGIVVPTVEPGLVRESSSRLNLENLRHWYVRGGGTLAITQEY